MTNGEAEMETQYEAVRRHNLRRLTRQLRAAETTLDALRRLDEVRHGGETSTYLFLRESLEGALAEAEDIAAGEGIRILAVPQPPDTLVGEPQCSR